MLNLNFTQTIQTYRDAGVIFYLIALHIFFEYSLLSLPLASVSGYSANLQSAICFTLKIDMFHIRGNILDYEDSDP